ncbi:diguanylate cyclase domain-containing protein [Plesiomonas shigelloides]|uniref:TackOD1 domain-containing metal-binding protein n=1 Tax=Plesiomonas shigelloides TaxID=703 RepID=UPI001C5B2113|nr:diguanylate cyclase [Plesiomonas shigelloides]MBW3793301.1 diguanylate cyclase [Plesiomonas shigelloides]
MYSLNDCLYWVGRSIPDLFTFSNVNHIQSVNDISDSAAGAVCFDYDDEHELQEALRLFFSKPYRWSWCVFTTKKTAFTECVADDVFKEESAFRLWQEVKTKFMTISDADLLSPLVGWLGINRKRRVLPLKDTQTTALYFYPIIECFYPDLQSAYNYILAEEKRGILEADVLVDRIRVCPHCHSGHLNYVEVCPSCNDIDIDTQSSLHCFTCGYVGEQQLFLRRGKLECPKCLTQLRHIGVDYDRPLENYTCNNCSQHFVEAQTVCQCLTCSTKTSPDKLIVRKIYKFMLGEQGEYIYQHGKTAQAPELSIKGKVDVSFFKNLILWVNKVALRHNDSHLLLALHLPSFKDYNQQHGESKLFSLIEQITLRLSGMFRDTDICCQYRQDVLLVLMPKTPKASLPALEQKLAQLSKLITDDGFELNVFAWGLPEPSISDSVDIWIENIIGEVYAS